MSDFILEKPWDMIHEWLDETMKDDGMTSDLYDVKNVRDIDVHFIITDELEKVYCYNGGLVPIGARLKISYSEKLKNLSLSMHVYNPHGRKYELKMGRIKCYKPPIVFAVIKQNGTKVKTKKYEIKDSIKDLYMEYSEGKLKVFWEEVKKEA